MNIEEKTIHTLRTLPADIVQKANSGHPGAPMGMAAMAYALFQKTLRFSPKHPAWHDRDRFVLSSGHASAMLYSLLHLYGYGLTMDDLKQFRQADSLTPGHPEWGHTSGVEVTTGPLGQGVANAVGFAIAEEMLAARFNRPGFPVVNHRAYAFCGDGCMMEGITSEAASLAGTLGLNKLTVLYDDNEISIEGDTDIAMREDVGARFEAYGWRVLRVRDANTPDGVLEALLSAQSETEKPTLIICPTTIGFGCPAKQGTASSHGEPLGADNVLALKRALGMPEEQFFVSDDVYAHAAQAVARGEQAECDWLALMARYEKEYPELKKEYDAFYSGALPGGVEEALAAISFGESMATRNTSYEVIQTLAKAVPNLVGGSADLSPSNKTTIKGGGDFNRENRAGRNLHFGVREHAMAAICNGIAVHGGLRVFCATFFVFSDYMRGAMRVSALMGAPVVYVLTHDSIGVGEDGPTHQPVEHMASLRALPGIRVIRPADGHETAFGWLRALTFKGPSCLVLSRQNLPLYAQTDARALKGGYALIDEANPDVLLLASGSEVQVMVAARELLKADGVRARVISMPCMEDFLAQSAEYKDAILPPALRARVSMEAGVSMPWFRFVGLDGEALCLDTFGASAPAGTLMKKFGFTPEAARDAALRVLGKA